MKKEIYSRFLREEINIIKKNNTPRKIQDFVNSLRTNFDYVNDTCMSPKKVLREKKAHCIEGAMLAAAMLRYHGYEPLLLDLESSDEDYDHVVALFKEKGHWGAISKTNHAVLRYREPIFRNIRELALSYFHEYFLNSSGKKTLRRYSRPVNLTRFDKLNWMTLEEDVWFIPQHIVDTKHHEILSKSQISKLRKADEIEIQAGKLVIERDPKE